MIVDFTKDYQYSKDGFTIISSRAGDEGVDLPHDLALNLIRRGVCVQKKDSIEKVNNFIPVEETAIVSPVEEVKKTRRKRKKKGE